MNSERAKRVRSKLEDKEYRHSYADSFLDSLIATQIKVLREQRSLSQKELAELAGMKQSRISTLENVNYSSWSVRTLRKLAKAFDLRLVVRFETFSTLPLEIERFSRSDLERQTFEDEHVAQAAFVLADESAVPSAYGYLITSTTQPAGMAETVSNLKSYSFLEEKWASFGQIPRGRVANQAVVMSHEVR